MPGHVQNTVDPDKLNTDAVLPYSLRLMDFQIAMQDVYDLFHDINTLLLERSLKRLEEMLRPAAMSGLISDLLTASLASHARSLTENTYFNGHPDLIVTGFYPNDSVQSGAEGDRGPVDTEKGRCGRHPRRARTVDVRVRLQDRHRDRTSPEPSPDVIHGGLSGSRRRRRLPE